MLTTRRTIAVLTAAAAVAAGTAATASATGDHSSPGDSKASVVAKEGDHHATIIGGHDATEKYPWNVSWGEYFHECGGVLIAPGWVLTAEHCTMGSRPEKIVGRIGSPTSMSGQASDGETIKGASWVKHPKLDLALLKLASNAKSPVVPVAPVPAVGQTTRIIGWGRTEANNSKLPTALKELDVKIADNGACSGGKPEAGEFCSTTTDGKSGACPGDSGGPEIAKVNGKWALIGVTSRGPSDCNEGGTIYGDVSAAAEWINKTAGTNIPVPAPKPPAPTPTPSPTTPAPTPTPTTPTPSPAPTTPAPTPTAAPTQDGPPLVGRAATNASVATRND